MHTGARSFLHAQLEAGALPRCPLYTPSDVDECCQVVARHLSAGAPLGARKFAADQQAASVYVCRLLLPSIMCCGAMHDVCDSEQLQSVMQQAAHSDAGLLTASTPVNAVLALALVSYHKWCNNTTLGPMWYVECYLPWCT